MIVTVEAMKPPYYIEKNEKLSKLLFPYNLEILWIYYITSSDDELLDLELNIYGIKNK